MAQGAFHHVNKNLLNMTVPTNTPQTGTAWRVQVNPVDGIDTPQQGFRAYFGNLQDGGATSPTSQVKLQTSYDGTNFFDVASSTQLTTNGSKYEYADISALGPYVRAVTVLAGGTPPNHTAKCKLVSNAAFSLVAV